MSEEDKKIEENLKESEKKEPLPLDAAESNSDDLFDYGEEGEAPEEIKIHEVMGGVTVKEHHHKCSVGDHDSKKLNKDKSYIVLPSDFGDVVSNMIINLSKSHIELSKSMEEWGEILKSSMSTGTNYDGLTSVMDKSVWSNTLEVGNAVLGPRKLATKNVSGQEISGETALLKAAAHMSLGGFEQYPLYHSGIWVTLVTPKESDIIDLFKRLALSTINLGRSSDGLIYSNMSVVIVRELMDFIADHIKNTTVSLPADKDIFDYIKVQDLYPLILAITSSMHPNGYNYRRPCVSEDTGCTHVEERKLNLNKLLMVNREVFDDKHKALLIKRRPNSSTIEEITAYQDSILKLSEETVTLNSEEGNFVTMILKSPSISDYLNYGEKWISEIVSMVSDEAGMELSDDDRNNWLDKHSQASLMRQYSHWVEKIDLDGSPVRDRDTIDKLLTMFSRDNVTRADYFKAISRYIDNSTISLVGIPVYECPECKKDQETEDSTDSAFVNVVPLEVPIVFFTLGNHTVEKIINR